MLPHGVVLGTLWMIQVSRPSSSLWTATIGSVNFTAPYLVLSFSLNVLSTLAIAGRLLYYRSRLTRVLGKDGGKRYIGMVAMIVESAAMFCALVIMVFVTYVMDHPLQNTFFQLFGIAQVCRSCPSPVLGCHSLTCISDDTFVDDRPPRRGRQSVDE